MIDIDEMSEPEDGTVLGLVEPDAVLLIWRNDAEAWLSGGDEGRRWFRSMNPGDHPVTWKEITKKARLIYWVGDVIAARRRKP